MAWPNRDFLDLVGVDLPIIQAPMAGAGGAEMAIAAATAGGLGSLPCALLSVEKMRAEIGVFRQRTDQPLNLNFFCHEPPEPDPDRETDWKDHLADYYDELGRDRSATANAPNRAPFDDAMCQIVEDARPEIVSFQFGLPATDLLQRVKATGAVVMGAATTVAEAHWLENRGCDAIIAQGAEAGGHRGIFLGEDITTQPGTMALVPQVVDAVSVPVIAAGGIADGRGVAASLCLGAAAAQVGTAYLFTPESLISDLHRAALAAATDEETALTNLISGRPARGLLNRLMRKIGPMSDMAPAFPTAGGALAPLRAAAEAQGRADFTNLWAGQAAALGHELGAEELTRGLAEDAARQLTSILPKT